MTMVTQGRPTHVTNERSIPKGDNKISRHGSRSPNYAELDHFTLLLCRERLRKYIDLQRTCIPIALFIKPCVW